MRDLKGEWFLILAAAIVVGVAAFAALPKQTDHANGQKVTSDKKISEDTPGPTVDYDTAYKALLLTDPKERALREARNRRYNDRAPQPFGEMPSNFEGYDIHTHWLIGLPSLPIAQSDAVVLGEVVEAQAYLSADKKGVYSEFTIHIEEVLKDSSAAPLTVGGSLIAEREGGVIRFKDGRLLPFTINNQKMPRDGRQYVFFLKHSKQEEDYHIITGYEFGRGSVAPLDRGEQFDIYKGRDAQSFLTAAREAIAREPRSPQDNKR
ncbi:MAG TPA: hypothetical protein VN687_19655 [Blastocatellia bacterium]|nr:hypothetical protein [Blastocatellia bacterium]